MVDVVAIAGRGGSVIAEAMQVVFFRAARGSSSQLVVVPPSYRRRFFGAFSSVPGWSSLPNGQKYLVAAIEWEQAVVRRYIRRFDVLPSRMVGEVVDEPCDSEES